MTEETATKCRRCTECVGQDHHWLSGPQEREDEDGEPIDGDYVWVCKHCPATRPFDPDDPDGNDIDEDDGGLLDARGDHHRAGSGHADDEPLSFRERAAFAQILFGPPDKLMLMRQAVWALRWTWAGSCRGPFLGVLRACERFV